MASSAVQTDAPQRVFWIGTDEAGLGPWVGPLVLAGVVVDAPASLDVGKLWRRLRRTVRRRAAPASDSDDRLVVCDSKDAFVPHGGDPEALAILERTVLSFARSVGYTASEPCFGSLLACLDGPCLESMATRAPWAAEADVTLPLASWDAPKVDVSRALARADVHVVAVRLRMLDAADYNDRIAACRHNKGRLIVEETIELLRSLVAATRRTSAPGGGSPAPSSASPLRATCGRLGGRKFYGSALGALGAILVAPDQEDPYVSRYTLSGELDGSVEFRVDADADHFLVALASMFAKYAREVYMMALNAHVGRLEKRIRRTSGYGTDGRRFIRECTPVFERRGIDLRALARER